MKTKLFATLSLIVIALTILTACASAGAVETAAPQEPEAIVKKAALSLRLTLASRAQAKLKNPRAPMPTAGVTYQTVPDVENAPRQAASVDRKIIKNAEVNVLVEDSDIAIDRLTQVVGDAGGYIVSSRVWYQIHVDGENYKYASITLGIPVDQFEVDNATRARAGYPRAG